MSTCGRTVFALLAALLLAAAPSAAQAPSLDAVRFERARFHLAGASSAVTNPLLGLALMHPHYQPALRFTLGPEDRSLGRGTFTVRFEEPVPRALDHQHHVRGRHQSGADVPREMRTTWPHTGRDAPGQPVNGTATYGSFRQFDVKTNTTIVPPPRP